MSVQAEPLYLWTIKDKRLQWCPRCHAHLPTYGEVKDGVVFVCCCWCQRVMRIQDVLE